MFPLFVLCFNLISGKRQALFGLALYVERCAGCVAGGAMISWHKHVWLAVVNTDLRRVDIAQQSEQSSAKDRDPLHKMKMLRG